MEMSAGFTSIHEVRSKYDFSFICNNNTHEWGRSLTSPYSHPFPQLYIPSVFPNPFQIITKTFPFTDTSNSSSSTSKTRAATDPSSSADRPANDRRFTFRHSRNDLVNSDHQIILFPLFFLVPTFSATERIAWRGFLCLTRFIFLSLCHVIWGACSASR